jgi:hypothetical protein
MAAHLHRIDQETIQMKRITILFAFALSFALMAKEIPAPQGGGGGPVGPPTPKVICVASKGAPGFCTPSNQTLKLDPLVK